MSEAPLELLEFTRDEALLEAFLAVEEAAQAPDPWSRLVAGEDVRARLAPDDPFFRAGGRHLNLLARRGGRDLARVTALVSPRLVEDGAPVGLLGFFAARPDEAAARALLGRALEWLRARGARRALGPMNGSTWFRYRLVTEGHAEGPFLLEPWNPPHYPALFEAAGLRPVRGYASLEVPHTPVATLAASYRRARRDGIAFEPLDPARASEQLPLFYELAAGLFAGKTAYSAITLPEFLALYGRAAPLIQEGLCWIARDGQGQAVGFLFAYPDLLEPARRGDPAGRPTRTVLKTMAVRPGASAAVGWAMAHLHIEAARAAGFSHGIYALMEKWEELLRFTQHDRRMLGGDTGRVLRRYALYGAALPG